MPQTTKLLGTRRIRRPARKFLALSFAAALAAIITLGSDASAQTFRGTILGTVTDPNGAVVPNADVTAKNLGTGIERSTASDEFGNYSITELQTGTYQVVVRKSGFEALTINGVSVEVAAERRVDAAAEQHHPFLRDDLHRAPFSSRGAPRPCACGTPSRSAARPARRRASRPARPS